MAMTKMPLKLMVNDFNRRGCRPHGELLTLSKYAILFDRDYFYRVCQSGGVNIDSSCLSKNNSLLTDTGIFSALGFERFDSMDISTYEGANIIHDLNDPNIPSDMENKYDFVLDAGTIEHVFNFFSVLEIVFKALKVGGTFFFDQPVFYGFNHGYHNFSPCLFHEYFKANNYTINSIELYVEKSGFVYVADNAVNNIYGHIPQIEDSVYMLWGSVTKTAETTFNVIPYQGIYNDVWKDNPIAPKTEKQKPEDLKLRIKNEISNLINSNQLSRARQVIEQYEKFVPNDPEIETFKAML